MHFYSFEKIIFESKVGELNEEGGFKIAANVESFRNTNSCKHFEAGRVKYTIVAFNEGGYNSTVVCLQCILDAVVELHLDGIELLKD